MGFLPSNFLKGISLKLSSLKMPAHPIDMIIRYKTKGLSSLCLGVTFTGLGNYPFHPGEGWMVFQTPARGTGEFFSKIFEMDFFFGMSRKKKKKKKCAASGEIYLDFFLDIF